MALVFIAGPLSGLIVQPLIGLSRQSPLPTLPQLIDNLLQVSWLTTLNLALAAEDRSS
jgi:hypothetical protein